MFLYHFLIFILAFVISATSFAFADKEINESIKCSAIFSYFEKRFNIPKDLLHAIALKESAKKHSNRNLVIVWPWTVNIAGKGYYFTNKRDAIRFAKNQLASGVINMDVGCMQINLKYHPEAFSSLEQAFSPHKNVAYGAKFLTEKYMQHGNWEKAVGGYHSENPERAQNYRTMVSKIGDDMHSYKKNLRKHMFANNIYAHKNRNYEKSTTLIQGSNKYKMKNNKYKVQVRVGRLNNNNWYRKRVQNN